MAFLGESIKKITATLDIFIRFVPSEEQELIPSLKVSLTSSGELNLYNFIQQIKGMGFPIENSNISYWSASGEMYVFCGHDPLSRFINVQKEEFADGSLKLKIKEVKKSLIHQLMNDEITEKGNMRKDEKIDKEVSNSQIKCRRTKEKKIGYIIDKVKQWRRLYHGDIQDKNGKQIRYSLEEAAQRVGISKKSLDDYLLQIRLGRKYGFNFNEHYGNKVGVLRAFVKQQRNHNKTDKNDIYE